MKLLMIVAMSVVLISCSSSPFKEEARQADMMMEHMSQGVRYSEGGFPDKYKESGVQGRFVVGVGKSLYPMSYSEQMSESAAVSNAKFNIVNSAPTTFNSLVEKVLSSDLNIQQFNQKDISVSKVKNLKGIEIKTSDVLCRTRMEPIEGRKKYKVQRECRAIARVSINELKDAYDFTISSSLQKRVSKDKIITGLR